MMRIISKIHNNIIITITINQNIFNLNNIKKYNKKLIEKYFFH